MSSKSRISASIDLSKIDKDLIIPGKNGAKYINISIFENEEPDRFGNTHAIKQEAPKDKRVQGQKTPYIGNGKKWDNSGGGQSRGGSGGSAQSQEPDDDDLPF